jgi:hypothetical protein
MNLVSRNALAAAAFAAYSAGANIPSQRDALNLFQKSIETLQSDWMQRGNRRIQSKDGASATLNSYEILMIDGSSYRRLISVDDKPLDAARQTEESRKLENEFNIGSTRRKGSGRCESRATRMRSGASRA